jgi:hypothetical protein
MQGGGGSAQSGAAGMQSGGAGAGGSASGTAGSTSGNGGSGTGANAGSGGTAGVPMTEDAVCRAVIEAQCEVMARCGIYANATDCSQSEELCPEYYFSPGSTRTVEGMASCLDELRNKSCDEQRFGISPSCLTPGMLADDAPCSFSSQCASGVCSTVDASATCTTCQPRTPAGEPCSTAFECVAGAFCDPITSTCVPAVAHPPAAEGAPCNNAGAPLIGCQGMLVCSPTATSSTPVCHEGPHDREACPDNVCAPGLTCLVTTYPDRACTLNTGMCDPRCPTGSLCVGGRCQTTVELGEACDPAIAPCAPGLLCKDGTCAPQPHRGEPCGDDDCTRDLTCTDGVCSLPASCP